MNDTLTVQSNPIF